IEKGGPAVGVLQVRHEDEIVIITSSGKLIRTEVGRITVLGRNTQGVKLMDLDQDDKIVSIGRVMED
ncbi:MAG TPA: DNA gyrase C-terminal beta-propeller domain-containing protein, partial [Dissulfurispiraceae bacterium]|nr:DNA gyrase C-terminal beta-propeller domain-containing protein [Dissulfurispiraceae bacterium]